MVEKYMRKSQIFLKGFLDFLLFFIYNYNYNYNYLLKYIRMGLAHLYGLSPPWLGRVLLKRN